MMLIETPDEVSDTTLLSSCLSSASHHPDNSSADLLKLQFTRSRDELAKLLGRLRESVALFSHDRVVSLSDELDNFSIEISLIGQVKAGKTALANALIGKLEMLPSDVNPWTSAVTSVHINTPKPDGKTAVFNFFTSEEWINMVETGGCLGEVANRAGFANEVDEMRNQICEMQRRTEQRLGRNFAMLMGSQHSFLGFSSNMLRKYVCLGDDINAELSDGRYADVTKSAELYIDNDTYRVPTIIRDTPGVNDPFLLREAVAIESMNETDIFVLVLGAQQSFSTVDVGLLRVIRSMKKERIIFFVNRVDELNDPAREIREIDNYIRQLLRDECLPEDFPIVFGSAAWAEVAAFGMVDDNSKIGADKLAKLLSQRQIDHRQMEIEAPELGTIAWTDSKSDDLSGLFELRQILERKSIKDVGLPQLTSIVRQALEIANTSRVFLEQIDETSWITNTDFDGPLVAESLDAIHDSSRDAISAVIKDTSNTMISLMLQAYDNFLEREKAVLEAELKAQKGISSWMPDIEVLRRALNAAYMQFCDDAAKQIAIIFSGAAEKVQLIYNDSLNNPVKIINVEAPEIHNPKSPACLMRSMPLDITTSWLENWMTRHGKQPAYLRKLEQLVAAEQKQTLQNVEVTCVADFAAENIMILDDFFETHQHGLESISMLNDKTQRQDILRSLGMEGEISRRTSALSQITDEIQHIFDVLTTAPATDKKIV